MKTQTLKGAAHLVERGVAFCAAGAGVAALGGLACAGALTGLLNLLYVGGYSLNFGFYLPNNPHIFRTCCAGGFGLGFCVFALLGVLLGLDGASDASHFVVARKTVFASLLLSWFAATVGVLNGALYYFANNPHLLAGRPSESAWEWNVLSTANWTALAIYAVGFCLIACRAALNESKTSPEKPRLKAFEPQSDWA